MLKSAELPPQIFYDPQEDYFRLVNVTNFQVMKGQQVTPEIMVFWNGTRIVATAIKNASVNLKEHLDKNNLASPGEMDKAFEQMGEKQNLSARGAARWFLRDLFGTAGYKESKAGSRFNPEPLPFSK